MKTSRRFVFPLLLTTLLVLLVATMPKSFGSAQDEVPQALAASKGWVTQIDAGHYEESYDFACGEMHDKVPEDHWVDVLKALRTPWGPVLSRTQISHVYKPDGVRGLPGECMVITYDTSFKKLAPATEEIILKWEDGKWRGAAYTAGPKSSPDDASASPALDSNTETHTEPHFHPTAQ